MIKWLKNLLNSPAKIEDVVSNQEPNCNNKYGHWYEPLIPEWRGNDLWNRRWCRWCGYKKEWIPNERGGFSFGIIEEK